jgi:hypothetical protein
MPKTKATEKVKSRFTKEQLVKAKRYRENRDILNVLLSDGCFYTFDEVDTIIINFKEREV